MLCALSSKCTWSTDCPAAHSVTLSPAGDLLLLLFIWWLSKPPNVSALLGRQTGPTPPPGGLMETLQPAPPNPVFTKEWRVSTAEGNTHWSQKQYCAVPLFRLIETLTFPQSLLDDWLSLGDIIRCGSEQHAIPYCWVSIIQGSIAVTQLSEDVHFFLQQWDDLLVFTPE